MTMRKKNKCRNGSWTCAWRKDYTRIDLEKIYTIRMDQDPPQSIVKLIIVIMVVLGYSLYQYHYTTTTTSTIVKMDHEILKTQFNPPNKPFIEKWTDYHLDSFLRTNSSCQILRESLTQKSHYPIAYSLVVHRNASEVIRLITSLYQVWCYITLSSFSQSNI